MKPCSIESGSEQDPTYEVMHETKSTSEISCLTDCCLAQLVEQMMIRMSGFKPDWEQFLRKFILFCITLDRSDNLTEMRQISLS